LTAYWNKGGYVYTDFDYNVLSIEFKKDSWTRTVDIAITPKRVGVTSIDFSNDVNSDKFSVLVIVTE